MRRQGWYPVNSQGTGVATLAVLALGGWQVGLCRSGMAILILAFGAAHGKLSISCYSPRPQAAAKKWSWSGAEEGELWQLLSPSDCWLL